MHIIYSSIAHKLTVLPALMEVTKIYRKNLLWWEYKQQTNKSWVGINIEQDKIHIHAFFWNSVLIHK